MANNIKRPWGKWLGILVVIAGLVAGAIYYFGTQGEAAPEYQASTVSRGELTQAVTATGQLAPVLNVLVGSQISGIVRKLYADYNSVVKSNQVVAEIDASTYEIAVLKAQAQLANSKANLALAEVQARRSDELFANRLIAASDHDTAKAQLLQAQAQVQMDEATLKNANVQLSYCKIYAPVDGVVISRNVDVGQTVAASFNTPTLFLMAGDLSKMQIDALVSEADIGGVATNQDVTFTVDAYPYRTFHGKVSQIRYGAVTNQNVVNYDCVVAVDNAELKLLPGMTANVSIIIAQRADALKIPNAALRFRLPETNGVAGRTGTNSNSVAASGMGENPGRREGQGGRPGGGGRGGAERGPGSADGSGPPRHPRPERVMARTIYLLPPDSVLKGQPAPTPKPVQVKLGISDGISTEVLEGLEEGAQVVTGMIRPSGSSVTTPGGPAPNPFGGGGGGMRRF